MERPRRGGAEGPGGLPGPGEEVAALAVSALYGGSGVPVDQSLHPLAPALIWMDRRAEERARLGLEERSA